MVKTEILAAPSGARLKLHRLLADGKSRGVIQINHGLAEHAARYTQFAEDLAAAGFHVYAHDHRGHGGTSAPDSRLGIFAKSHGTEKILADVEAIHDLIAAEHPKLPVICFGHSMGGLIALNYAIENSGRIAGLAVWNANFSAGATGHLARLVLAWERFRLGFDIPSRLLPSLTFAAWAKKIPDRETPFDWLSRDRLEVEKYINDPLCGWNPSVAMWQDIFDMIFRGAEDNNLAKIRSELPINLVGGGNDPATFGGQSVRRLESRLKKLGFENTNCTIYPETRHESLNEVNRKQIVEDFITWLEKSL